MSGLYDKYRDMLNDEVVESAEPEKTASRLDEDNLVEKLASALEMVADALPVDKTAASLNTFAVANKGTQKHEVGGKAVKSNSLLRATPGKPSKTGLADNMKKTASAKELLMQKLAGLATYEVNEGPKGAGKGVDLVSSNEAAMNFTRREAWKPNREELKALFNARAQSAEDDPALRNSFANTEKAGTKLASKNKDRSYMDTNPISRALTSPAYYGITSGASGAAAGGLLGTHARSVIDNGIENIVNNPALLKRSLSGGVKGALLGGAVLGGGAYGVSRLMRELGARGMKGRIVNDGKGLTRSERKILEKKASLLALLEG